MNEIETLTGLLQKRFHGSDLEWVEQAESNVYEKLLSIEEQWLQLKLDSLSLVVDKLLLKILAKYDRINRFDVLRATLRLLVAISSSETSVTESSSRKSYSEAFELFLIIRKSFLSNPQASASLVQLLKKTQKLVTEQDLEATRALVDYALQLVINLLLTPIDSDSCDILDNISKKIAHNFLTQGLDNVLLLILAKMNCSYVPKVIQIVRLLLKGQKAPDFARCLSSKGGHMESSEDDVESDHTPYNQRCSSDSLLSDNSSPTGSTNGKDRSDSGIQQTSENSIQSDPSTQSHRGASEDADERLSELNESSSKEHIRQAHNPSDVDGTSSSAFYPTTSSGISNASSEEEASDRVMHKVLHHSKASKQMESDSSDDYDRKRAEKVHRPHQRKTRSGSKDLKGTPACSNEYQVEIKTERSVQLTHKNSFKKQKGTLNMESNTPAVEDIALLLKDFAMTLINNHFGVVVILYKNHLLESRDKKPELQNFLWMLSFFSQLSAELDVKFDPFRCFSFLEVFSYLTFEGIQLHEKLELLFKVECGIENTEVQKRDLTLIMNLLVSSIQELLSLVELFSSKDHFNEDQKRSIFALKNDLCKMTDFRLLFVLLIRSFRSDLQKKQYLRKLIVTHHKLLRLLDASFLVGDLDLYTHLNHFASFEIMGLYGEVLEDFEINNEFVNDSVLTMMYHVAGDLKSSEVLLHPTILRTYSLIMNSSLELKEFWLDLIGHVLNTFVSSKRSNRSSLQHQKLCDNEQLQLRVSSSGEDQASTSTKSGFQWQDNQEEQLCSLNFEMEHLHKCFDGFITSALSKEPLKRHESMAKAGILFINGFVDEKMYRLFNEKYTYNGNNEDNEHIDKTKLILEELYEMGFRSQIQWIKNILTELYTVKREKKGDLTITLVSHCYRLEQPVPLVPFTKRQELALCTKKFTELLQTLGLQIPTYVTSLYPRIPAGITNEALLMAINTVTLD